MTVRASYGIFYDNPHLFFNTRFANNPPWGAQITLSNPAGGLTDPYQGFPGGNPFPALANISPNSFFPLAGIYVNAPLDIKPTNLQQWNLSVQRQVGEWLFAGKLSRQQIHAPMDGTRSERGGLRRGRDAGQYQSTPRA